MNGRPRSRNSCTADMSFASTRNWPLFTNRISDASSDSASSSASVDSTISRPLPELEIAAWGRLPLAYSARCFTARALDLAKDDCGFRCLEYPDGLPLASREGIPFLNINGIQVQTSGRCDLGPELDGLRDTGIDLLRLYPQAEGTADVVARFRDAIDSGIPPARAGEENGYWHGTAGMQCVTSM